MRRFLTISIGLVCAATTMGCEDGPNQTGPAPSGAAGNWNNGGPDAAISDPGMQAFDAGGGGTNAVNVCSAPQQNAAWAKAFAAPVVPPFQMGGVDLSNGGTFLPVKLEDVIHGSNGQTQLCQGQPAGACSASGEGIGYSWGPSGQLYTCYDPASHALTFFTIFNGYSGTVTYKLPKTYLGVDVPAAVDQAGNHVDLNYVWEVGKPITENGKTLDMGWTARGAASKPLNKLYLGQLATFAPSLIAATTGGLNELTDASYDCHVVGKCRTSANPDGSGGNFGCRPTALYADFALSNLESSNLDTASSPSDIYMYPAKYEPYSFAPYDISLDNMAKISTAGDPTLTLNGQPIYGPFAPAGVLSPAGAPETPFCTIFMGQTFGQLLKNCVNVTGTASVDQTSVAKLLGTQAHSNEWYTFSINGINENFSGDTKELTQNGLPGVLQDAPPGKTVTPNSDDVATDFFDDIRAYGQPLNEMRGDSLVAKAAVTALDRWEDANFLGQDQHGSATVTGYYRQLTYNDLLAQNLAAFNIPAAPLQTCWVDSTTQSPATWVPPAGCTGFEQMVTVAIPSKGMTCVAPDPDPSDPDPTGAGCGEFAPVTPTGFDYNDLGVGNYGLFFGGIATMFRPGDPEIDFLADPRHPENGSLWDALNGGAYNLCQSSLNQVIAVMGHGNINNVPPAARDWRYYFKFWAQAWVKYMLNRASDPTWAQLYADDLSASPTMHQVNQDALFFDLENGLDRFEYVDRSHAAQLGAPLDMSYDVLINSSNVQDNNFFQRLSRAESALYVSELGAAGAPNYPATTKADVPGSNENVNITDLFGSPAILGAFGAPAAADAMGNPIPGESDGWYCYTHVDPNCGGAAPPPGLVDGQGRPLFTNYHGIWAPTAFGKGQPLTITQTLPFIQSALITLPNYANPYDITSATTPLTNTIVPWIPQQPTNGFEIPINGQRTQFVQTASLDFSGVTITTNIDYIAQYDKTGNDTGGAIAAIETQDFLGEVFPCISGPDILRVKMYTPVLDIINWLEQHPGAQSACNIYVKYSPYNNFPDYVTSIKNGVLMSINPGAGGGPGRVADATLFDSSLLTQSQ
jgi:hypothetical protein